MRTVLELLERVLRTVDRIVRPMVVFALLLMTAVLFFNSTGRSVLNVSFVGGPALARLLVIWLTFLGAYLAVRSGAHITIDLVRRVLPERMVATLTIAGAVCGAATSGYIAWLGARFTWTRFAAGQLDPMLEIPAGLFYLPLPIGAGLMALAFAQLALRSSAGRHRAEPRPPSASRDPG